MKRIIVRADYYPDGSIMPLSVTINQQTHNIDVVKKTVVYSNDKCMYICQSNGKTFKLLHEKNHWQIE